MAKTSWKSVDDYLAAQPAASQVVLETVRRAIRKALPAAEEVISYQIPAYRQDGIVLYFAGWKAHYSLYPVSEALVAAFATQLAPYEVGKGTIRFPMTARVPVGLIGRIARFRAKEVAVRAGRASRGTNLQGARASR